MSLDLHTAIIKLKQCGELPSKSHYACFLIMHDAFFRKGLAQYK